MRTLLQFAWTAQLLVMSVGALAMQEPAIKRFELEKPMCRAMRETVFIAEIRDASRTLNSASVLLTVPSGMRLLSQSECKVSFNAIGRGEARFKAIVSKSGDYILHLKVLPNGEQADLKLNVLPAVPIGKLDYILAPVPVKTTLLIGAHNCPLWERDRFSMWDNILKHPERTPALGFYAQENPEVSDWETKWAVEHGVSFFIYCWYRASQGGPVIQNFGSAIHEGFFKSRFGNQMKFTIMWENQSRGNAGVSDEHDLMTNLLPFWIENYFKRDNYLKVDNKPILFIYRPEFLIDDLGSVEKVRSALDKMRQACRVAGFDGLTVLGEYRGLDADHFKLMKSLGLDYTFAYCWYVPDNPTPEKAIETQEQYLKKTGEMNIIPQVPTVSQAWSGWQDEGTIWKIPPQQFESLLRWAKDFAAAQPADSLGSKMLLLDNWNEWGEGHYIAPYREYGFGYLDAVRRVFSQAPEKHVDLLPEDIGRGPYDTAFRNHLAEQEKLALMVSRKVTKSSVAEPGLVAWWTFDEDDGNKAAYDWTGHGLGGEMDGGSRTDGMEGKALVCDGHSVTVPSDERFSVVDGLTISCWVKTEAAGQANTWIVNRVYGGCESTGYRLGVLDGKPCFEVPQAAWSHHLKADIDLPLGSWVYLAGTFDGKTMRLYVNGELHGEMERPGRVNANSAPITLGSYEKNHPAHFVGLLDEVKLYSRTLTQEELVAETKRMSSRSGSR